MEETFRGPYGTHFRVKEGRGIVTITNPGLNENKIEVSFDDVMDFALGYMAKKILIEQIEEADSEQIVKLFGKL